jgi:hypothetical protein
MHPLKPLMKKLLIVYAFAVAIVIIYFILRLFFHQETALELKHFNTQDKTAEIVRDEKEEESEVRQKFMLLPQK